MSYLHLQMCKAIDDSTAGNDTLAKLYGAANIYYNYSGDATCFNPNDYSDPHGMGEWAWQVRDECLWLWMVIYSVELIWILYPGLHGDDTANRWE